MSAPSISLRAEPHCPVHVATPMTLVKARAPNWLLMPEGATDMEFDDGVVGGMHKKRFERKFWKCPVAGCFRVQSYEMTDGELKELRRECPSCGASTDASAMQRAVSQFTCKKCLREKRELKRFEAGARRAKLMQQQVTA
jgi:ribosomal protein S27AE